MPRPFKIYRIICTLTDKSLVSGTDKALWYGGHHPSGRPLQWHQRGSWSATGGAFWKTENAVRRHLQNLCHDWVNRSAPSRWPRYPNQHEYWTEAVPGPADWSRLQFLRVEQIYVSNYATTSLLASDFMGIPAARGLGDGSGHGTEPRSQTRDAPESTPTDQEATELLVEPSTMSEII